MTVGDRQFPAVMDGTARIKVTCRGPLGAHKPGKTIGVFGWCPPVGPLNDGRLIGHWLGRGPGISYRYPEAEFDEPGESRKVFHEGWKLWCRQCERAGRPQTLSLQGLNRRAPNVWSTTDLVLGAARGAGRSEITLQEIAAYLGALPPGGDREIRLSPMPGSPDGVIRAGADGAIPSWAWWQYGGFAK